MRTTQITRLKFIIFLLMLFSLTLSAVIVCAQTQYVSDELVITLREGQGSQYKIIKMLKTGTPLEIIEESDPYLKVRTEKGDEGWVLNQYITEETPKTVHWPANTATITVEFLINMHRKCKNAQKL